MSHHFLIAALLIFPLAGFLANGLRFKSKNYKLAGTIASSASGLSFVCSLILFGKLLALPADARTLSSTFFDWIVVGDLKVAANFIVDQVSIVMLLIITGVGTLIHIFSIGYISHDERPTKYFAYLNFFLFNMLLLVLGGNLLVTFVGWEGVGLCSYLLIGFWFTDKEKAAAGMKAFITNRVGDAGFLIGMFILFMAFGTLDYATLNTAAQGVGPETGWTGPLTLACLFLFIGATGKSAQIPLYVWLPDAMAGPTPVSALIHAATMVTAGVYLIIRMNFVFMGAPNIMMIIAIVGALTAVMAATIGMTQWDIKKVLAYSTVSQLGYMFLAVGVGAFMPALFHLMTHAFFKALMFLGSGSVIHAMHEEQDIRKMGGLKKAMPITYWTFMFGWLAIIGIPPFAGFFSKDEILWYAFSSPLGHWSLWLAGAVGAAITAFYMTRLMALVFWGESRVPKDVHPHESPSSMAIPLMILGFLSIVGGWVGIPHVMAEVIPGHPPNLLGDWVKPLLYKVKPEFSVAIEWMLIGVSVAIATCSAAIAYTCYSKRKDVPEKFTQRFPQVYNVVSNKYFVDEIYFGKIINPLVDISKNLWLYIDVSFIDKATYLVSDFIKSCASGFKSLQNGNMQQYAMYIGLGTVAVLTYILVG